MLTNTFAKEVQPVQVRQVGRLVQLLHKAAHCLLQLSAIKLLVLAKSLDHLGRGKLDGRQSHLETFLHPSRFLLTPPA